MISLVGRKTVRHATAGPSSTAAMARLLGLAGGGSAWRLEGLCSLGVESVRVGLAKAGGFRLVFFLLPKDAPGAQVRGRGLSLSPEREAGPEVLKFLAAAAVRLGPLTVEEARRGIDADPETFVESVVPGQEGDFLKVPCVGQSIGLLEAGWRNFFCDQDFEVQMGVPECKPNDRTLTIEYADLECFYSWPKFNFKKWTFLDYPEEELAAGSATGGGKRIMAELEERDMILGTGERADALVSEVRSSAGQGKYLVLTHLCTPIIMGDDLNGLARRCEEAAGATAVSWSQKDRDERDNFGNFFRELLAKPGFFDAPPDPEALNLFYFPPRYREAELLPLLGELGLKANLCAFPDVDFPAMAGLARAGANVFCERSSYPSTMRELLAKHPRRVVTAPAPFGVEATRRCLRAVAAAGDKEAEFERAWAARLEKAGPAWEAMKAEAAALRLAFVVSEATLPRLLGLRYGQGAPMARMAGEMGFGIDLLFYDLHGAPPVLPEGLKGAGIRTFRTPRELEAALGEGDFRAVYSDMFFDWRISRAGKARFSSKDFEMGLGGALRSLKRLLSICRLPFYRRYGPHLRGEGGL